MLTRGTLLAGRFEIEGGLGGGGMGAVHRALDREAGRPVAVKVMLDAAGAVEAARFAAEIGLLADLHHPRIVAYVAHGTTEDGHPYLVMDLLEGEDLAARLARGPLSLAESVDVIRFAAEALLTAHRRGIVHRDLKPQNLFLRGAAVAGLTVLDFGVARVAAAAQIITTTGAVVGTPRYMAPEQIRDGRAVTPAADVFSLGCVLYQCLTGRPAFPAEQAAAALAAVLFEDPPEVARLRADVPADLGALVHRLLDKDPAARPADAAALLDAVGALGPLGAASEAPAGLGRSDLLPVTMILAVNDEQLGPLPAGDTPPAAPALAVDTAAVAEALREDVVGHGASIERLADGAILITLGRPGQAAVDRAAEAAEQALAVRARWPGAAIAILSARRMAGTHLPLDADLDRARALCAAARGAPSRVVMDTVTTRLLQGRVGSEPVGAGLGALLDATAPADEARPLLGKPTPCVGREAELAAVEAALAACLDERAARPVLVVAPAGGGKSRLRHELSRRAAARGGPAPVRIEGRGEALRAGTPYGLLGRALQAFFGVAPSGPLPLGQAALRAGVERFLPRPEAASVAEFLGEICDLPFLDDDSVRLRAARQDPRLMHARIGEAFLALLDAASQGGVELVLEDLHWADRASLDLCALSLRRLADRPLFLLAFARPEIHDRAPGLWKEHLLTIPLRPLTRRAAKRLVTEVAGERLDDAAVARIVEQAGGDPLFLEELIRAACEGDPSAPPETVLAMLEARLGRLGAADRRLLRAAAVFGERFSAAGVIAVLGAGADPDDVARRLARLADDEVLAPRAGASEGEHRFRHALLREAAYALLTDDDRRLGHHLAARWLSDREQDPALVAEHYLLAGEPIDAGPFLVRAAQRAHDRDDYAAAARHATRGREAGVAGEALGAISALDAFAAVMRGDWKGARAAAAEADALLAPGGVYWCHVQRTVAQTAAFGADRPALLAAAERFLACEPDPEARVVYADSAVHIASALTQTGLPAHGRAMLARAEVVLGEEAARYPAVAAFSAVVRGTVLRHTDDPLAEQITLLRGAMRLYEEAGPERVVALVGRNVVAEVLCRAGQWEEGQALLRESLTEAEKGGGAFLLNHTRLALANGLYLRGEHAAAEEQARAILATPRLSAGYEAMARDVLAVTLAAAADFTGAEAEARAAIALSQHTPVRRWLMAAHLSTALLGQGRAADAHAEATAAVREMDEAGTGGGYAELSLLVAATAAARAAGQGEAADALLARARSHVARQAAGFGDAEGAARYLASVPASVR